MKCQILFSEENKKNTVSLSIAEFTQRVVLGYMSESSLICFVQSLIINQDPVVQSIVSLTSSLVVKMLTVLVSTISNSHIFLLKNVSSYSHFSSKKY